MPKRSNKRIPAEELQEVVASAEPTLSSHVKNPAAVALGKLGGAKGGAARAKKLTAEQRSAIAKKAAAARWAKKS